MSNPEFENAVKEFLAPILSYLSDCNPSCRVYWVYPNEPEENHDFSLPLQEVEHYTRSFMFEGFYAAIRAISNGEKEQLQIVFWEEWGDSFKRAYWPGLNAKVMNDWVRQGFSSTS